MYFGDTNALEDALQRHVIRWDGLARNVEYLGMPDELKRFLGRWHRRWLQSVSSPSLAFPDRTEDLLSLLGNDVGHVTR